MGGAASHPRIPQQRLDCRPPQWNGAGKHEGVHVRHDANGLADESEWETGFRLDSTELKPTSTAWHHDRAGVDRLTRSGMHHPGLGRFNKSAQSRVITFLDLEIEDRKHPAPVGDRVAQFQGPIHPAMHRVKPDKPYAKQHEPADDSRDHDQPKQKTEHPYQEIVRTNGRRESHEHRHPEIEETGKVDVVTVAQSQHG